MHRTYLALPQPDRCRRFVVSNLMEAAINTRVAVTIHKTFEKGVKVGESEKKVRLSVNPR